MPVTYDYKFCPLPSPSTDIRILKLREGEPTTALHCTLTTRPLKSTTHPLYEALSYHWGDGEPTEEITLNTKGKDFPDPFMVRPNLASALKQLRYRDRSRYLWIDAICINQDDNSERNVQVALMDGVYGGASEVCVWLGDAGDYSDLALSFISRVVILDDFDRLVTDSRTPHEWTALSDLMKREWFSRRWVVQEIALAKSARLYCGDSSADWSDFAVAVSLFEAVETEGRSISKTIQKSEDYNRIPDYLGEIQFLGATRLVDATSNLFRKAKSGEVQEKLLTLEALVSNLSAFKASRPHDTIYAVLALAKGIQSKAKPYKGADGAETPVTPTATLAANDRASTNSSAREDSDAFLPGAESRPLDGEPASFISLKATLPSSIPEAEVRQPATSIVNGDSGEIPLSSIPEGPVQVIGAATPILNSELKAPAVIKHTDRQKGLAKLVSRKLKSAVDENTFLIDYDTPFFDVCKDFLTFTVKMEGSLDIICRPWVPVEGFPNGQTKPSWLLTTEKTAFGMRPDKNYSRANADTLVGAPGLGKRNYNASKTTKATPGPGSAWHFGTGAEAYSMFVEGFIIDEVRKKGPYAPDGIILNEWLIEGGWDDHTAEPPDQFWRTLVADRGPNGLNPPTFYPRACKAARNQSVKGSHISTSSLVHYGKSTIVAKFARRVQEVIWMRRLVTTERDLLGLVPAETKKRDLICILYGCSVPVVLRRHSDSKTNKEYFQFMGECYVHGLMDGEAFDIQKDEKERREKKEKEEKDREGKDEKGQEPEQEKGKTYHDPAKRIFELR